ncbi:radial spoke head 14 homolog [Tachyglossus aculeatus]|uniref:radial spoke head 14 homolog n=1 Tax=Tachyglossus aculeatus TaxID=9261 RepID=UPI0018F46D55|nr:radial spoke head 14 homolog [Tachyglossus aculeatus]XP_038619362.1 radial spoke head 14 homolog [Tachyglossus aculeatus]
MAGTWISAYLPPDIDPTKAPVAFGERALPKLNEELQSPELITRQRALMALCDLVHDPEYVYQAINIGFLESLKNLLLDADDTVRHKTTEVLFIMSNYNVGRDGILENGVIPVLAQLIDDPLNIARRNLHNIFWMVAQLPAGAKGIVENRLIPALVKKLRIEMEEIQELILETLYSCLQVNTFEALESGAVPILRDALYSNLETIRSGAARAMMAISVPLEGKKQVCDNNVIPVLVHLLKDQNAEVQANAAGALMNVTVTTEGKYTALSAGAIFHLLELVNADSSKVRLNSIKALTMLAEAPEGRKKLLEHLKTLQERELDPNEAVSRAARIAVKVIQWRP